LGNWTPMEYLLLSKLETKKMLQQFGQAHSIPHFKKYPN